MRELSGFGARLSPRKKTAVFSRPKQRPKEEEEGKMIKAHVFVFVVLALMLTTNLKAVPITFEFSGVVTEVDDPESVFDSTITVDSLFNGAYTFNSDVTDSNPDPKWGRYYYTEPAPAGFSMSVSIENMIFESVPNCSFSINNEIILFQL